jgi:hypothetical protein
VISGSWRGMHYTLADHMRGSVALLVLVVGCGGDLVELQTSSAGECARDEDCVAVAARCCDCPTFAVPSSDASYRACIAVPCPEPRECPSDLRATCDEGRCELACVALACQQSCANGFATEGDCLTCTCAAPVPGGCSSSDDCIRVRADCCGCAHGGRDTAVLAHDAASHEAGLRCGPAPQCPSDEGCDAGEMPACVQGRCELTLPLPANACGRSELPPCPAGETCVVNGPDRIANRQGVGVCVAGVGGPGQTRGHHNAL